MLRRDKLIKNEFVKSDRKTDVIFNFESEIK